VGNPKERALRQWCERNNRVGLRCARWLLGWTLCLVAWCGFAEPHVVLIVVDGVRWQELTHGADERLVTDPLASGSLRSTAELHRRFGGATAAERRQRLWPFLWTQMIPDGQFFGDRERHSLVQVENDYWFSYPGYNEMLTGVADRAIASNAYGPNPNETVWERLEPRLTGAVAVYATWDKFHDIFNDRRSALPVLAGQSLSLDDAAVHTADEGALSDADFSVSDAQVMGQLIRDLSVRRPQLLFVGFGEADNWAHAKRYDEVLSHLQAVDRYIETLWSIYQRDPATRDQTTFIITTDHGRGAEPTTWSEHWRGIPGSNEAWLIVRGPSFSARGAVSNVSISTAQVAATVAACLHYDWRAVHPQAAMTLAMSADSVTGARAGVGAP